MDSQRLGSPVDPRPQSSPLEGFIQVAKAAIYSREIGDGLPIIVLHGGPDFDHRYLLPDMDRLSDSFRLIYYDQRGRGRSAENVDPQDINIATELDDLDTVRTHFGLTSAVLLGHSWGALLALEYAVRRPDRVSHLILMNPAPASSDADMMVRKARQARAQEVLVALNAAASTPAYRQGDPDAVAAMYGIQYQEGLEAEHLERLMVSLRASFTREGILKAREIEDRLLAETLKSRDYDLLPKLKDLHIPTLVIRGDRDFIPSESVSPIAQTLPQARMVTIRECGHFSYLERPEAVRSEILEFLNGSVATNGDGHKIHP